MTSVTGSNGTISMLLVPCPAVALPSSWRRSFSSSYCTNQPIICRHSASVSSGGRPFSLARAFTLSITCWMRQGTCASPGFGLELPGAVDVAEALGDEVDEGQVDAVDLGPHLAHVAAILAVHVALIFSCSRLCLLAAPASLRRRLRRLFADRFAGRRFPPALRHREAAGGVLDRLRGAEQRRLVERLADELQPQRRAFARTSPAGTEMPGRPAMFTVTVKMSSRYMAMRVAATSRRSRRRATASSASAARRPFSTPRRSRA